MTKKLIKNEEEFNNEILFWTDEYTLYVFSDKPAKYPCLMVSRPENNPYGKDRLNVDFVYLSDFEE